MTLSVLICTYNRPQLLSQCLEALLTRAAEKPDDPESRSQVAEAHRSLGLLYRHQGNRPDAAFRRQTEIALADRLIAELNGFADPEKRVPAFLDDGSRHPADPLGTIQTPFRCLQDSGWAEGCQTSPGPPPRKIQLKSSPVEGL